MLDGTADRRSIFGRTARRHAARGLFAAAWLPVIAACSLSPDPRNDRPDATVGFATDWQKAADCSAQQLGNLYAAAKLRHHADQGYAEIVVGIGRDTTSATASGMFYNEGIPGTGSSDNSGYSDDGTIMIIDFRDAAPGQAEAKIFASRYMLLPGNATDQAAAAMASCRTGTAAAKSAVQGGLKGGQ